MNSPGRTYVYVKVFTVNVKQMPENLFSSAAYLEAIFVFSFENILIL